MPIRDGELYCVNHPNKALQVAGVERMLFGIRHEDGKPIVDFSREIPIWVYCCEECGYLELYLSGRRPFRV